MSDLTLFDSDNREAGPNDPPLDERRADNQWLYTVAIRQGLSVAHRHTVAYADVLAAADKYANEILGRQKLLFYPGESETARAYREKAALLTAKRRRETPSHEGSIQPIELINQKIEEQEELLKFASSGQYTTQQKELAQLYAARDEFTEQHSIYVRESEVLRHEWNKGINLPTFFPQQERNHHDFALPNKRVMRIWFTHETKTEDIAGVDLIYEYHIPEERKARIAAIQYKLPEEGSKNIIINEKMQAQLDRMCAAFCGNDLCAGPSYDDQPIDDRPYTLPHCCAFFRPTNRLQQLDARPFSTGYHIRRCDIDRICEYTQKKGNKVITPEISRRHGISYTTFDELFNTERLGSRWLTYEQLQKFHEHYEVITPFEQAGIYIQEAPQPELATLF